MNKDPQQDPGEDPPPQGSSSGRAESPDLKDQLEHQQVVIAQFKEMLQKTDQSNSMQEKVDRYASTLSKMTMRAKRSKLKKESGSGEKPVKSGIETPVNEKISLLRRQLEENKVKLAERGKSQKDIEEMVHQLKAQFDDSLQLIHDTSSNFSISESKTDYSKSSSSDELYNILISKEKKITDLNSKVQKLETMVLDLQENLKEKDCVIDARTKAITLMSESLSKKTKNTQDTLDETKEHMRKMQEDFIQLENEMKARQMKLLDDLRLKNLEIAELQEVNESLQKSDHDSTVPDNSIEINEMKNHIADLTHQIKNLQDMNSNLTKQNKELTESNENIEYYKKQLEEHRQSSKDELESKQKSIDDLKKQIEDLKLNLSDYSNIDSTEKQADELGKLKKELDDLNKNMIKVKSEHKKKIKLLNKRVDSFKKMGDMNAQVVKLSEENDSLNERIAELEEEKGNYQLKMMEEMSSKDSVGKTMEEMEIRINDLTKSLEDKTDKFEILLTDNTSLKNEIDSLNEKLKKFSDIHNEKVTSEISSIQYEEKLQKEMEDILAAKEKLETENNELLNKVEILTKEKSELNIKLEQYLQENMELIDKLEKMSAEKVSSAESIEIVENLTMQEKLELDEYQKNLDPQSGKLKTSEEQLDENPDLNDSVNRLTEETSELLQKIELFTVERREVMEKMESLSTENAHLNLKLKQVENNSELLTETYEQLQSEKEKLDEKLELLEKENDQLKCKITKIESENTIDEKDNLKEKLFDLEGEYIKLGEENERLSLKIKEQSELIHEKNQLEVQLKNANKQISDLESKINENLEEIKTYQLVIDENKDEFIKSSMQLNELKEIIAKKEKEIGVHKSEIENLNLTINNFNETINKLEHESKNNRNNENTIENMEKQLRDLKKVLDENIGQIADYENELEENSNLIKQLNQQLKELSNKNLELQNILDNKNEEQENIITKLNGEIEELKLQIKSKDEMFHTVSSEMKDKFLSLQKQTDINTESLEDIREPLQKKIEELTSKNNALVEKMKKIAANLKKKTLNCQELEKQLNSSKEKWETESKEKDLSIKEAKEEIQELRMKSEMYQSEINQLKHVLNQKVENNEVQEQSQPVKGDLSLHEELLGSNFVQETFTKDYETKIQELELIIETQQNDLGTYKERISVLEETLSKMDEKRESLEQKTNELGVQLAEKAQSFEEISKTEDLLEEKLKNLSKYNEELEKKLEELTENNGKLVTENTKLRESAKKLKQKLIIAQERVNELSEVKEKSSKLEEELEASTNHILTLEQEVRKLEHERVVLQESAKTDLEKLDNDWQLQFDAIAKEKSELTVMSEKLNERIAELIDSEQILSEKIKELEIKLETSFELQESCDNELSSQREEIQLLKNEVEKKNEEIENNIIEIRNLQSTKQIELNVVNELKKENEILNSKLTEISQQFSSTETLLSEARRELEEIRLTSMKHQGDLEHEESQIAQPLFTWAAEEKDPFSFVKEDNTLNVQDKPQEGERQVVAVSSDINTQDELLQKIKTLEFMLKNVEIERDELMNQCSHLSNELMNMVYHSGQVPVKKEAEVSQSTQEEILNLEPVNEPPFEKKSTYLCYPGDKTEESGVIHSIESQILSDSQIEPSVGELQEIEFTKTRDVIDCTNPFLGEPVQKKDAYLCYPEDDDPAAEQSVKPEKASQQSSLPQVNIDTFGENDDGWGWSPEEAKLEEQQNQEFESNPLRIKIVELEDKMRAMEIESQNKHKEFQELQIKSGKMMKKLKELKLQNEKLQKSKKQGDNDMFDLESAVQEELKTQVETLEKRIGEIGNELAKEKNEKQTLQKKIESLISTNQRMVEMKEKSDIEMLMWQRKTEELKSKIDQFEWKECEGSPEKSKNPEALGKVCDSDIMKLQKKIAELNETIRELTLDNEELQALLEEQRSLRITAEKAKSVEPIPANMKTESEYMEVVHQKQILETEMTEVLAEKTQLEKEFNHISSHMKTEEEFNELFLQKQNIETQLQKISLENENLQKELNTIATTMKNEDEYNEIVNQKQILEQQLNEIVNEKKKIQDDLNQIIQRNDEQTNEFQNLLEAKLFMEKVIEEKDSIITKLMLNSEQNNEVANKLTELENARAEAESKVQELLKKIGNLEECQLEAVSRIDTYVSNEKAFLEEIQSKNETINCLQIDKDHLLQDLKIKENEIENIKLKIENDSSSLKTEVNAQTENIERLIQENQDLTSNQELLKNQIENLSKQIQTKDAEFMDQKEKLDQDWQALVDQRGSDVAESWKIHLDMRETEFSQLEQQLKKEINDLEEKCNGLVNENNELRKNVDTEIRNEVDRVSALQQQINDRQQYINDLSKVLNDKQLHIENVEQEIQQLQRSLSSLQSAIEEKDIKINELQIIINTTQKQFNETRLIVEDVVKLLEEKSLGPILFDLESIKKELSRQLISPDDLSNLQKIVIDKDSIIANMENELAMKVDEIANYQSIIDELRSEIAKLKQQVEKSSSVEDEIQSLTNDLKDKEGLLSNIQAEFNTKLKELEESTILNDKYKVVIQENEKNLKELKNHLAEKEGIISNLNYQLEETLNLKANEDESTQNLHYSLQQCRLQCDELRLTLDEKCSLIDVMNSELEKQHNIHVERESDMEKLKVYVEELQKTHFAEKEMLQRDNNERIETQYQEISSLQNKLSQLQLYNDELISKKELAQESTSYLEAQIQEQLKNMMELSSQLESYKNLNDELSQKLSEFEELQRKYEEQNILLNEEERQMDELKAIIENQVVKIEDLKQKLFEKSNDYDSLIAELDIRKSNLTSVDEAARQPMGQGKLIGPTSEDDLNEWVTRSELDIALYMLHQRDVRCEELTVELTQLLEERDTLQLRLSNALREKEEYKRIMTDDGKTVDIPTTPKSSPSRGAIPKGKVSDIVLSASGAEIATEAQESGGNASETQLENKLSELKNIGYRRDKTLLDEQQQRRLQQLSIMQQHIDEASKLPQEAAARLVDANYTLSRDVQSPSKVLLNWLWGRSTPKVNDL